MCCTATTTAPQPHGPTTPSMTSPAWRGHPLKSGFLARSCQASHIHWFSGIGLDHIRRRFTALSQSRRALRHGRDEHRPALARIRHAQTLGKRARHDDKACEEDRKVGQCVVHDDIGCRAVLRMVHDLTTTAMQPG